MDKATLDSINTIFNTAFGKHMSEIEAKINTITQANKESTEQITQTITGLKQTITQNTESITQVTQRVDTMENNFENKFESFHRRITNLE